MPDNQRVYCPDGGPLVHPGVADSGLLKGGVSGHDLPGS